MKKIIVIKIGRNIATTYRDKIDLFRMEQYIKEIKLLQQAGYGVVLVISGSVTCGQKIIQHSVNKQVAAGVGQAYITAQLFAAFTRNSIIMSQMLLTRADILYGEKRQIIVQTIQKAVAQHIVMVLNENDVIDLNSFEGNDFLASVIAQLVNAEKILFLSDIEGVYDQHMHVIHTLTNKHTAFANIQTNTKKGIGGIQTKINAARLASMKGITTYIGHGKTHNILQRIILNNEHIGTKILAENL